VERDGELKEADSVIRRERYSGAVSPTFSVASDVNENHSRGTVSGWSAIADVAEKAPSTQKRLLISEKAGGARVQSICVTVPLRP
jgi:HSP20 family protein